MALLAPYRLFATNGAIVTAPGLTLFLVTGWSASAATRWLQLFEASAAPAAATIPRQSFPVLPGAPFSFAQSALGPPFMVGCFWAVSTTGPTYTQSADSFWMYAEGQT